MCYETPYTCCVCKTLKQHVKKHATSKPRAKVTCNTTTLLPPPLSFLSLLYYTTCSFLWEQAVSIVYTAYVANELVYVQGSKWAEWGAPNLSPWETTFGRNVRTTLTAAEFTAVLATTATLIRCPFINTCFLHMCNCCQTQFSSRRTGEL